MDGSHNTFPMDITDPSSRPWNFRPEGYLVVILAGTEEAERAEPALVEGGFAVETSSSTRQADPGQPRGVHEAPGCFDSGGLRSRRRRGSGALPGHEREDRCALWLRLPDEAVVPKALRVLADQHYLHTRYYGSEQQNDFHVS
jgi:hypothetical protein